MTTVRSNQANRTTPKSLSLSDIQTGKSDLPSTYVIYGPPGVGKTTLGASFPNPVFLQSVGEKVDALVKNGRLPETLARFPESQTWEELGSGIKTLTEEDHNFKTVVIDTLNGAEKLLQAHEMALAYDGNARKFTDYGAGERTAAPKMLSFLASLDSLRERRKMSIVLLAHSRIKEQKNPEGENYDRYEPDFSKETLATVSRWSDALLFLNFFIVVNKDGIGLGGEQRVMHCERRAAYEAKNRLGLPATINLGDTKESAWSAFCDALKNGKAGG